MRSTIRGAGGVDAGRRHEVSHQLFHRAAPGTLSVSGSRQRFPPPLFSPPFLPASRASLRSWENGRFSSGTLSPPFFPASLANSRSFEKLRSSARRPPAYEKASSRTSPRRDGCRGHERGRDLEPYRLWAGIAIANDQLPTGNVSATRGDVGPGGQLPMTCDATLDPGTTVCLSSGGPIPLGTIRHRATPFRRDAPGVRFL